MAKVKEHLKSAEEFYEAGLTEFQEGRRLADTTRMREGCEKIFHAYIEATASLIQKSGLPEPESHGDRWEALNKLGERRLIEIGDAAFLYLHQYGYYQGKIRPEAERSIKEVKETLDYIIRKLTHES